MRKLITTAVAAGTLLIAASALADTAKGLVPEQADADAAASADTAALAAGVPKELIHVVRDAHNAVGGSLPEPASWGLMILGIGGMGAILRGQRRVRAALLGRDPN